MYLTSLHNTNELLDLGIWTKHDEDTYSIDLKIPAVYYTGERMASYTLSKDEFNTWIAKRDIYADHFKTKKIDYDCVSFSLGDHEIEAILDFVSRDFGKVFDFYQHKITEVCIEMYEDDIDLSHYREVITDVTSFISQEDAMLEDTFIDDVIRFLNIDASHDKVAHIRIVYDDEHNSEKEIIIDCRDEEDKDVETE